MSEFNLDHAARFLEGHGWKREVAGDYDFNLAARAIVEMVANPDRGLMLMGNVGVGKTFLADIVFKILRGAKIRIECSDDDQVDYLVPPADATQNGGVYSSGADDLLLGHVYLDDLGSESLRQSYGNILDRCGKFLTKYHSRGRGRLIVTTNLNGEGLGKRYGDRVFDRLVDKCIVLKFSGKSKRERTVIK